MSLDMPSLNSLVLTMDGSVANLVLNRPAHANAVDANLWQELRQCFEWLDATVEVRVVILSGSGENFCAGIDFAMLANIRKQMGFLESARGREALRRIIIDLQDCVSSLERCRKPVIAAIHGACVGAGLDLVSCCDMRYASADALFAIREIDLGIVADVGVLQRLPRVIGEGVVREMAFTGRDVASEEALRLTLINGLFATKDELMAGVREVARSIALKSPLAVRGIKEVLNFSRDHSVADGLQFVAAYNAATLLSADLDEALRAKREGRAPSFSDR